MNEREPEIDPPVDPTDDVPVAAALQTGVDNPYQAPLQVAEIQQAKTVPWVFGAITVLHVSLLVLMLIQLSFDGSFGAGELDVISQFFSLAGATVFSATVIIRCFAMWKAGKAISLWQQVITATVSYVVVIMLMIACPLMFMLVCTVGTFSGVALLGASPMKPGALSNLMLWLPALLSLLLTGTVYIRFVRGSLNWAR